MAKYFQNFPTVAYKFGDNESPVLFNNLSAYVDIVDQIKDNVSFYNKYTIQAGDRPDTLSYKLYNTVDYYWTFFLMNDHLRISGWPIPNYDILDSAKSKYPYRMVTTNTDISTTFPVGQTVTGNTSGTIGVIKRKILELGQLVIDTGAEPNLDNFGSTEVISYTDTDGNIQTLTAVKESEQYNAVHHYEDTDGVQQDITLFDFANPSPLLTPITYRDRLESRNEELKEIIVLREDAVGQVVSEFNKLMRQ